MKSTFNLFVHPATEKAMVDALTSVKENIQISHSVGLSEHEVLWEINREKGIEPNNKVWFKISVSRPFLIFKIGCEYTKNLTK